MMAATVTPPSAGRRRNLYPENAGQAYQQPQQQQMPPMQQPGLPPDAGVQQVTQQFSQMGIQQQQQQPNQGFAPNTASVGIPLIGTQPMIPEMMKPSSSSTSALSYAVCQAPTIACPPSFKRCTLNAIPQSYALLSKSRVPLGLMVDPYRALLPGEVSSLYMDISNLTSIDRKFQ
jgi:protein transport protein SEC24